MKLAKKLKFAQTCHIMCGDSYCSLVLQHPVVHHAVAQICSIAYVINVLSSMETRLNENIV